MTKLWFREALFGSGFFHGDLHSGNIFLDFNPEDMEYTPSNTNWGPRRGASGSRGGARRPSRVVSRPYLVTLIDFGNTGFFSKAQQDGFMDLVKGIYGCDDRGCTLDQRDGIIDALIVLGPLVESDRAAFHTQLSTITSEPDQGLNQLLKQISTAAYINGNGTETRSLISFIRAKILLENQLEDLNTVLEDVDPRGEAFDPTAAYTSVIKSELIKQYAPWVGGGLLTAVLAGIIIF